METIRGFFFAIFHYYILKCLFVCFIYFFNVIFSCNFISNVTADYFWNILHLPSTTVRHQLTFIFLFIKSVFLRSNSTPLPECRGDYFLEYFLMCTRFFNKKKKKQTENLFLKIHIFEWGRLEGTSVFLSN